MSLNNLLNQFLGSTSSNSKQTTHSSQTTQQSRGGGIGDTLSNMTSQIPGGVAGGVAAGGIMALLMGNKSARKVAGKAASYGGAALLGGLAFKAYQNWQQNNQDSTPENTISQQSINDQNFHQQAVTQQSPQQDPPELLLIKAMIASAKADGHIDAQEQAKIFQAVEKTTLSAAEKGVIFEYLQRDIPIFELTSGVVSMELKAEIYLASCLVITPDHPAERSHLDNLAMALQLPSGLPQQLEQQAHSALSISA